MPSYTRTEPVSLRTKAVWAALVLAMTGVGGALFVLQGGGPGPGGLTVAPLLARTPNASIEVVFNTRAAPDHDRFRSIMIHDSGSHYGKPSTVAAEHRAMNLRGLGHHFLIGNGNGMEDGELHVGYRWLDQLPGAHASGPDAAWYNHHAISICLIGDGDRRPFTETQLRRLTQLVAALADEYDIPDERIVLNSETGGAGDPGRFFPAETFRERLRTLR